MRRRLLSVAGLAALAGGLLGPAWYSPWTFGYDWFLAAGLRPGRLPSPGGAAALVALAAVHAAALAAVLVTLYRRLGLAGAGRGAAAALALWLLAAAVPQFLHHRFAGFTMELTWIDAGYDGLLFALTGALAGAFSRGMQR